MVKKIIRALNGEKLNTPPLWMMRQAGRYLPEYRELRKNAHSFLNLCYSPELAAKVTLQPIERFQFDAAILFSDILVIPHALGRNLKFEEGRGPILDPIEVKDIKALEIDDVQKRLQPAFETIKLVKQQLNDETALIGFCGAPFTVATYMIAGHSTKDQEPARQFGYKNPQAMKELLALLADVSAEYLIHQIEAGADIVQIFDSWAGVLDEQSFEDWCIKPILSMVQKIRAIYPNIPIIGFPRGAGMLYEKFSEKTGVSALGLDWSVPLNFAVKLQKKVTIQGNLDPLRLVCGGKALDDAIDAILKTLNNGPFIFNLGHGIMPNTPIDHVQHMINRVRNFSS